MMPTTQAERGRCLGAAALTFASPGFGQAVSGHGLRGTLWAVVVNAALLGSVGLAFAWWPALPIGLALGTVAAIACAFDAYRTALRPRPMRVAWWLAYGVAAGGPLALFVIGAVAVRVFVLEAFVIPSEGMCPSLRAGDQVFVDKRAYRSAAPARGDIVVYARPASPDVIYVHRVIAIGGDEVVEGPRGLSVNGQLAAWERLDQRGCGGALLVREHLGTSHRIAVSGELIGTERRIVVPAGHVLLAGDNRDSSYDGRDLGPVPVSSVRGKVWRRWVREERVVWERVE
jgi:signal peptidase I